MDELRVDAGVLVFPGLGSPFVGMASPAGEGMGEVWRKVSGPVGVNVHQACLEGPASLLKREEISQAALLAHGYGVVSTLGRFPRVAMGYSVGGYTLLAAFGIWSLEQAQAAFAISQHHLSRVIPPGRGDLMGVLGLPLPEVLDLCQRGDLHLAAINGPLHTLVGGEIAALEEEIPHLRKRGALSVRRLGLAFPYHTALLKRAVVGLKRDIPPPGRAWADLPLWCGGSGPPTRSGVELVETLADQLATPLLWWPRLCEVAGQGGERVIDAGPGRFLSRLARSLPVKILSWEQATSPGLEALE